MASITCGHCRQTHASVADVAQCAWYEAEAKYEYELMQAEERYWESGTEAQQMQYAWEVEQDELRAAWGLPALY